MRSNVCVHRDRQNERPKEPDINSMQHEIAQMDSRIARLEEEQLVAEERTESVRGP